MTKITYVEAVTSAIESGALSAEVVEKLEALKESLVKKASAPKKPTKVQLANEGLKESILEALAEIGKPVTVSELSTSTPVLNGLTTQKITPLLSQLVDAGKVVRTIDHRKALFSLK